MRKREDYCAVAQRAVIDTAQAFHINATTDDGRRIQVSVPYQIEEPGFRPFRAGKASPEELQVEYDRIIENADQRGIAIGIENEDSVRKLAIQMGLGIDCSNFALRFLTAVHQRMKLVPYAQTVFRAGAEIRDLHATKKPSWDAKAQNGEIRELLIEEKQKLEEADMLDAAWIAKTFGKDPEFIIGSAHICDDSATQQVEPSDLLPGDIVAFTKLGAGVVSHLGIVEEVDSDDETVHAKFWHSWHTRDFESGLRRDSLTINPDSSIRWSHAGLEDSKRYQKYCFRRASAMAIAYSSLQ